MEINAFKAIVEIVVPKQWYDIIDFGVIAGFQLKIAGIDWRSENDLAKILAEMFHIGFLEINPTDKTKVRVHLKWFEDGKSI